MNLPALTDNPAFASLRGGRKTNQDAAGSAIHGDLEVGGYVILGLADGMGSQADSGLIARAAVEAACVIGAATDHRDRLVALIDSVRDSVDARAESGPDREVFQGFAARKSGAANTTLVVATVTIDGEVQVGWIGDSRAYLLLADGRLVRLTTDHNQALIGRPDVLTRSLRRYNDGPEHREWIRGDNPDRQVDAVLLTSDGVHGVLDDHVITYALATASSPARAVRWLTSWAVRAGGRRADNATCVLLAVPRPAPAHQVR